MQLAPALGFGGARGTATEQRASTGAEVQFRGHYLILLGSAARSSPPSSGRRLPVEDGFHVPLKIKRFR